MIHLVVVVARFSVDADAVGALAAAFMDDDRTATVWIEPDRATSRMAFDISAETFEDAAAEAVAFVHATAGSYAEIVSVGRPAVPEDLA